MVWGELFKIIGVSILTTVCYVIVKPIKPEIAIFITIVGSCLVLIFCIDYLSEVIFAVTNLVEKTGINSQLFSSILKIIGIGYLTEFASNLCLDSGNSSMSERVLFAGKIGILVLSLPIITNLLNIIIEILP